MGLLDFSPKVSKLIRDHVGNKTNTGAVYTRLPPSNGVTSPTSIPRSYSATASTSDPTLLDSTQRQLLHSSQSYTASSEKNGTIDPTISSENLSRHTNVPEAFAVIGGPQSTSNGPASMTSSALPKTLKPTTGAIAHGQDSPVMNETLSVINEHITDMKSPQQPVADDRKATNDSSSDYSSHLDQHRLSYINGEETDEEEDGPHTREEVLSWTPDQVAEYLFTTGVEQKHCEILRDEDFSGAVILAMSQETIVNLKDLELGSIGRRLNTWFKIKALQTEVEESSTRRNTATYGSEAGSEDAGQRRSRSNTGSLVRNHSNVPRVPSVLERPSSKQTVRYSQQASRRDNVGETSPVSPLSPQGSPRPGSDIRPSPASIREMQHSRQNSATAFSTNPLKANADGGMFSPSARSHESAQDKHSSFDKDWTIAGASTISSSSQGRPLSSTGFGSITAFSNTDNSSQSTFPTNMFDFDRGYFSGGEAEAKNRNVLRKRGSNTTHSRNSSYTDEQRLRSATANARHSRFGSVDSARDSPPSAAQKYYGINGRRRTPSESSINPSLRPMPPPKDATPAVTRLDGTADSSSSKSPASLNNQGPADWALPTKPPSSARHFGLRAISDAVTGHERSRLKTPTDQASASQKDSPIQSPSRTEGSTPSGEPSFELGSPENRSSSVMGGPGSARANRKKSKKETSAYTRGLEKKPPQEQMVGADYSGWMKKKSSTFMTTWKPRLFILKGRRLSYYYSEDDTQEQGLIDISFHRVLPADGDKLTGLHATLTGATNSPTSPPGSVTQTMASAQAAAEPESTLHKSPGDAMFIFKLVPPRTGLSRAVTFTKPTVHYFAVQNVQQGRLWMAALMKATIDRDDSKPILTTYQQKTISLAKARAMRHRPPALMGLDETVDDAGLKTPASDRNGLNIQGIIYDKQTNEGDSGVSGVTKGEQASELQKTESATTSNTHSEKDVIISPGLPTPQTA